MNKRIKVKLTVAYVKCVNCGFQRKLYFLPDFSYGERIVTTKNGEYCAYVNLLNEKLTEELTIICKYILGKKEIDMSKSKMGRMISNIYPIVCDDINGMKVENTPSWKCPNCTNGKMEEDKEYGEKLEEMEIPIVTHDTWREMDKQQKIIFVEREMKTQGYIN